MGGGIGIEDGSRYDRWVGPRGEFKGEVCGDTPEWSREVPLDEHVKTYVSPVPGTPEESLVGLRGGDVGTPRRRETRHAVGSLSVHSALTRHPFVYDGARNPTRGVSPQCQHSLHPTEGFDGAVELHHQESPDQWSYSENVSRDHLPSTTVPDMTGGSGVEYLQS